MLLAILPLTKVPSTIRKYASALTLRGAFNQLPVVSAITSPRIGNRARRG
jgi:hypothetical protein